MEKSSFSHLKIDNLILMLQIVLIRGLDFQEKYGKNEENSNTISKPLIFCKLVQEFNCV